MLERIEVFQRDVPQIGTVELLFPEFKAGRAYETDEKAPNEHDLGCIYGPDRHRFKITFERSLDVYGFKNGKMNMRLFSPRNGGYTY